MRSVFVAATRQHVGKSTTSLGLLAVLSSRVPLESIGVSASPTLPPASPHAILAPLPPTGLASRRISAVASHRPRLTPHSRSLTGPGYLKPIGQQHVEVQAAAEGAPPLRVDKDCRLAKEYFGLRCEYKHMSPVLMPSLFSPSKLKVHIH